MIDLSPGSMDQMMQIMNKHKDRDDKKERELQRQLDAKAKDFKEMMEVLDTITAPSLRY